mmetsp:Transcript_7819/g.18720  ORF Transcript_7819/g.18720 Transcript_7819/m.18720 type:complete len:329 (+) Transcript_7819:768-1754(+)
MSFPRRPSGTELSCVKLTTSTSYRTMLSRGTRGVLDGAAAAAGAPSSSRHPRSAVRGAWSLRRAAGGSPTSATSLLYGSSITREGLNRPLPRHEGSPSRRQPYRSAPRSSPERLTCQMSPVLLRYGSRATSRHVFSWPARLRSRIRTRDTAVAALDATAKLTAVLPTVAPSGSALPGDMPRGMEQCSPLLSERYSARPEALSTAQPVHANVTGASSAGTRRRASSAPCGRASRRVRIPPDLSSRLLFGGTTSRGWIHRLLPARNMPQWRTGTPSPGGKLSAGKVTLTKYSDDERETLAVILPPEDSGNLKFEDESAAVVGSSLLSSDA